MVKQTFKEAIFADVDLDTYRGKRYTLSDGKGNIIEDTDDREIFHEMAQKILYYRERTSEAIEKAITPQEQVNAALGLESATRITDIITAAKQRYQSFKADLLAANTLEEVEIKNWSDQ